ncbi:MAG: tetratricopeptide repeat protein [Elusimicrobiales bacterium]|nr:tetratricopeptide repeat protein [Elusimicrobiales bacterium]
MTNIILAVIFTAALCAPLHAQQKRVKSEESLFLDLHKTGLGSLNELDEKRKFIETIKLEKQKIQGTMLNNVYENAFEYYKRGNYEDAKDLAAKILSIDPNNQDAQMLLEASNQLRGSLRPGMSEKLMIEDRFKNALSYYTEGRIVEAHAKMQEVVKLSPNNIKAKYWLAKMKDDLKEYYFEQGAADYKARDLKGSLDNFYNALLIKPKDGLTIEWITRVEDELRQQKANDRLKEALEYYAQGKLLAAYQGLRSALEVQPGDSKAGKLLGEVKTEIENGFVAAGKKLYGARRYPEAIGEWDKAKPYTSNMAYLNNLISRARQQMKLESDEKRRRAEEAARRAREEEERRAKEEEDRRKAEAEAKRKGMTIEEVAKKPAGVSEENKAAAQTHYLEGLKYFQNSNYDEARNEWTKAKQLDPTNADTAAGLKRIEQILAGGQ